MTCFIFTYAHENFHFHMNLYKRCCFLNFCNNNVRRYRDALYIWTFTVFNFLKLLGMCFWWVFTCSYGKSDLHRLTQLNSTLQSRQRQTMQACIRFYQAFKRFIDGYSWSRPSMTLLLIDSKVYTQISRERWHPLAAPSHFHRTQNYGSSKESVSFARTY